MHSVHQGKVISYARYVQLRLQAVEDAVGALSKAAGRPPRGRAGTLV
jgi:hypothetical protein